MIRPIWVTAFLFQIPGPAVVEEKLTILRMGLLGLSPISISLKLTGAL